MPVTHGFTRAYGWKVGQQHPYWRVFVSPWRRELSRGRSPLPGRALDLFIENPYWSVGGLSDRLEVAFSTAQRAIDRLESLSAITLVGEARRNRICCAGDILEILEDGRLPRDI